MAVTAKPGFDPKTNMIEKIGAFVRRPIAALGKKILGTITSVSTSYPVVALTFDDGPHPRFTPMLLDILMRHRARATFFMLGIHAKKYPAIVDSVARDGHAVGNHSWDHQPFPSIGGCERRKQIRSCEDALRPHGLRIFRPPYGFQTLSSRLDAFLLGYQVIAWNVSSFDWVGEDGRMIADRVVRQTKPGSIILFHDALASFLEEHYESREQTLEAIDILLSSLGDRYRFVTVPELLQLGRPQRSGWLNQGDADFLNRLRKSGGNP